MNADIISAQFQLQADWFFSVLKDISDEESNERSGDHTNPMKWIAGHLLSCRMTVIQILTGTNPDASYQAMFGKGTKWAPGAEYPTIEHITQHWIKVAQELVDLLKNVKNETWQSLAPFQTSIPDGSLAGLLAYFAMHESYHIGQLSVLRKSQGKSAMYMGRTVSKSE